MDCLKEDMLLALLDGSLGAPEKAAADEHLAACERCFRLVAISANSTTGLTAATDAGETPAPGAASRVGRFEIEGPIGAGGMGIIYSARDPELGRRVAVKLLRPGTFTDASARNRVLKEARAMARLSHPNVVAVYEVGSIGDQIFIAMELVRGRTLRQWLSASERGWREICAMFLDAGRGLAAAHAAGLVHRDFKPENVLVGDDGRVLVTDFGLAKRMDGDSGPFEPMTPGSSSLESSTQTPLGSLVGTPAYMAPEQLRGERADARSDLFAFCSALYEAVAGTRPYPAHDFAGLLSRSESGVLEQPKRQVPKWLQRELARGLRPDPAKRFPSIAALITALERGLAPRRGRWVAAGALLAAIAALAIGLRAPRAPLPRRTIALAELRDPNHTYPTAGWLAPALGELLATELGGSPELRLLPPSAVRPALAAAGGSAAPLDGESAGRLLQSLAADALVTGTFEVKGGRLRVELQVFAAGGKLLGRLEESDALEALMPLAARLGKPLRRALSASAPADLARIEGSFPQNPRAVQLYVQALTDPRVSMADRVAMLREAEKLSPGNPRILAALTDFLLGLGAELEAREAAGRARLREDELSPGQRGRFEILRHRAAREFDEAIAAAQRYWKDDPTSVERGFLLIREQGFAGKSVDALVTIDALRKLAPPKLQWRVDLEEAMNSVAASDWRRARAAAARAAARGSELPDKRALATARRVEGDALVRLGEEAPLARKLLEESEAIFLEAGDPGAAALAQLGLSSLLSSSGEHAAARARIEAAMATWHRLGNREQEAAALISLAKELRQLRDLPQAVRRAAQAKVIYEELGEEGHRTHALTVLGELYDDAGDLGGASEALEQATAAARAGKDPGQLCSALVGLARVRKEQDELPAARKLLDEARATAGSRNNVVAASLNIMDADLSFAEGRFTQAASAAVEAARRAQLAGQLAGAGEAEALLTRSLLAQEKLTDAKAAVARARSLMSRAHGGLASALVEIAGARVLAREDPAQLGAARASLRGLADEATRTGVALDRWEALLALAELEPPPSRAGRLQALSRQARAQGFKLYARYADAASRAR